MPRVTIRTGVIGANGHEELLSEFMCDAPGCPNIATDVVGHVKECGFAAVMCQEHAAALGLPVARNGRSGEAP